MNKLFIINPISGGAKSSLLRHAVRNAVSKMPDAEFVITEGAGHARELAADAVGRGIGIVVAVGGDGTVNEVASSLVGTGAALGIVPIGSGNGLARHLHISLRPSEAIKAIREDGIVAVDSATVNGRPFFCTAGIGFDAQVAADYAKAGTRGLLTYAVEAVHDWTTYKPEEYAIETEEGVVETRALLITCGNANQWGNDFYITPQASLRDGKLDLAIVKPTTLSSNFKMLHQLRSKTLSDNPDVVYLRSSFFRIKRREEGAAHFDGEETSLGKEIVLQCMPASLRVCQFPETVKNH